MNAAGCPGCEFDASNTAAVRIEVPNGVTFLSSGSGFAPLSTFDSDPTPSVPEPPMLALLSIGLAGIWLARKRTRTAP
ncbi:MAG: PEP-CTERM sorting domain-containing protein [Gammaproteobacteria bacterium]